jgi:hypothetical protein
MPCCDRYPLARMTLRGVVLTALLLWFATGGSARAESFINYLYVAPNEGDSSGGHVALRFGNETFHFQHEAPGILRLQRHDAAAFNYIYAGLGNRAIRENTISVSNGSYALLRDAFARLLVVQEAQLEIRDLLKRDVAFFGLLLRRQRDDQLKKDKISLPLSGVGYLLPDAASPSASSGTDTEPEPGHSSPSLVSLRNRIRATYGPSFIAGKAEQARALLRGLELRATRHPVTGVGPDTFPSLETPVATRYEDALRAVVALQLLQSAPQLRAGTFWSVAESDLQLEPRQLLALKLFAAELERDLTALATSPRADWATPFVLGMARLAAIEATLACGRLVLLDVFPSGGYISPRQDRALRPYLPMMRGEMRRVFLTKSKRFFSGSPSREADYAALERSGNLLLDVERSLATGTPLRAVPKSAFPSREALVIAPPPEQPDEAALVRELAAAGAAETNYSALLRQAYGYDLFRHNCVTELFAVVNRTIAGAPPEIHPETALTAEQSGVRDRSRERLGGYLDAGEGLAFIPFVSSRMVESSFAVTASRDLPSYRTARLHEMQAREVPLQVFLRECNTITSSVYRPGPGDSAFLFFTDDALLLRPLFGAFNLVAALGESLLGVAALPLQGPERLVTGSRGMLFSLPELLFVNLRKGTMAYVEDAADGS